MKQENNRQGSPKSIRLSPSLHIISYHSSLKEGLERLNRLPGGRMTLFAVDPEGRLKGTVTDGDIRRALIAGKTLDTLLSEVMNSNFLSADSDKSLAGSIMEARRRGINLFPMLEDGRPVELIDPLQTRAALPIDAVLMAGGRGERLRPLTDNMPKPLLPVGGKPVIDYNVEALERMGVRNIFVTVNYLGDQLKRHFDGREGFAKVTCVSEPCRLGTLGSLSLVEGLVHDHVLVMNSDLLTDPDYEAMYSQHVAEDNDITMGAVPYAVSVPYAVMKMEGNRLLSLDEKPTFNYLANAGVYLMKRELIDRLAPGEYIDAPDFINLIVGNGGKAGAFPIEGRWLDIGTPEEYKRAERIYGI